MDVSLPVSKESPITTNNLPLFLVTLVLMQMGVWIKLHGWLLMCPICFLHALHSFFPDHYNCNGGSLQGEGESSSVLSKDKNPVHFISQFTCISHLNIEFKLPCFFSCSLVMFHEIFCEFNALRKCLVFFASAFTTETVAVENFISLT